MQKRLVKWIKQQYYKDGVLYTILKEGTKPRTTTGGRKMPLFARPVSRYPVA